MNVNYNLVSSPDVIVRITILYAFVWKKQNNKNLINY